MAGRQVRVEFTLGMPGRASWNGQWSGEGQRYAAVRSLTPDEAQRVLGDDSERSYYHRWSDGWGASVTARRMDLGERTKPSDGFAGYGWMIDNIIAHGSPYQPDSA